LESEKIPDYFFFEDFLPPDDFFLPPPDDFFFAATEVTSFFEISPGRPKQCAAADRA
jgi:hypothetical protein